MSLFISSLTVSRIKTIIFQTSTYNIDLEPEYLFYRKYLTVRNMDVQATEMIQQLQNLLKRFDNA